MTVDKSNSAITPEGAIISKADIEGLMDTVRNLYTADSIPWIVGYSGGKDSTATLQLVWLALSGLPAEDLRKPVYIIHTDTMVESPVVEKWAADSINLMNKRAEENKLPFKAIRLTPAIDNTFWVNLLGRGYPFPRKRYRWCTDRLKIQPVNNFIRERISQHGEIILVLGTRKAESSHRARSMISYEKKRVRELLNPSPSLVNELVFSPLAEWTNDDVWLFLMQYKNPWGYSNNDLLTLYRGATADNECPLMVEKDLPSCGKSRFGCWICTMVTQDKSMEAMIANDDEKQWLAPLLDFRNEIGNEKADKNRRSFRKMNGTLQGDETHLYHGPYLKETRDRWLEKLLKTQQAVRDLSPDEFKDIELITIEELRIIRRLWVFEKHEFDDSLPRIYEEVTGYRFSDPEWVNSSQFGSDEWLLLKEIVGEEYPDEELLFELLYSSLDIEARSYSLNKRSGLLDSLEHAVEITSYRNEDEAFDYFKKRRLHVDLLNGGEKERESDEDELCE